MAITELIVNGGFEAGSLTPWVGITSAITSVYTHSGFFAVELQDAVAPSVVYQIVNGDFSQGAELFISVAKEGVLINPLIAIVVTYFDANFNFLLTGLVLKIRQGGLINELEWLEFSKTVAPAPVGTAFAILSITRSALPGSAAIVVDDASLVIC